MSGIFWGVENKEKWTRNGTLCNTEDNSLEVLVPTRTECVLLVSNETIYSSVVGFKNVVFILYIFISSHIISFKLATMWFQNIKSRIQRSTSPFPHSLSNPFFPSTTGSSFNRLSMPHWASTVLGPTSKPDSEFTMETSGSDWRRFIRWRTLEVTDSESRLCQRHGNGFQRNTTASPYHRKGLSTCSPYPDILGIQAM